MEKQWTIETVREELAAGNMPKIDIVRIKGQATKGTLGGAKMPYATILVSDERYNFTMINFTWQQVCDALNKQRPLAEIQGF